jgi:hypothetical protein
MNSFSEYLREQLLEEDVNTIQRSIKHLIDLSKSNLTDGDAPRDRENPVTYAKQDFHRTGRRVLKAIATQMGLPEGSYDIRSNLGGIAVSGEITLHGENIYIKFSQSTMDGNQFFYRKCNGRKDYSGERNHWMKYEDLLNFNNAIEQFTSVASKG